MNASWLAADWPAPDAVVAGTTLRDSARVDFPGEPLWLDQVHGARVVHAGSDAFAAGPPAADASIADRSGVVCVVRTADCLPILLCARDGREVAAVHAGWRGLAAGIAEATVARMASAPADLLAWFGPAISQPAFEVGAEVREAFIRHDAAAVQAFEANARGRWQADLYLLARQRLRSAGVTDIHGGGLCTFADADRFFSFRRDGRTGRLVSFIYRQGRPTAQSRPRP
jgi:YfiH family protein